DSEGDGELPVAGAGAPPLGDEVALGVELLDPAVCGGGDVDVAGRVRGDAVGVAELAVAVAGDASLAAADADLQRRVSGLNPPTPGPPEGAGGGARGGAADGEPEGDQRERGDGDRTGAESGLGGHLTSQGRLGGRGQALPLPSASTPADRRVASVGQ